MAAEERSVHGVSQHNSAVSLEHVFLMILSWKTKQHSGREEEDEEDEADEECLLQPETVGLLGQAVKG